MVRVCWLGLVLFEVVYIQTVTAQIQRELVISLQIQKTMKNWMKPSQDIL